MRRWFPFLLLGLVLAVGWYALRPDAPRVAAGLAPDYAAERARKDSVWRFSPESPLPDSARARFRGLAYFPPDSGWRVVARYEPLTTPEPLLVPFHNAEAPEPFVRVAHLTFERAGQTYSLTALRRPVESATAPLFVPFTDGTTGRETYGAGRYLDVPSPPAGETTVVLDFNRAYAPTCAHVPDFVCPLPPAENRLTLAVRVGEKE